MVVVDVWARSWMLIMEAAVTLSLSREINLSVRNCKIFNIQHKSSLLNNVTNLWAARVPSVFFHFSVHSFHLTPLFARYTCMSLFVVVVIAVAFFCSWRKVSPNEFPHLFIWEWNMSTVFWASFLFHCISLLFSTVVSLPPFSLSCLLFYMKYNKQQKKSLLLTNKLK